MGLIKRTTNIVRTKADKKISSMETAEVVANTTMREINQAVADMEKNLHAVKVDLIRSKTDAQTAKERAEILERQARAHAGLSNMGTATEMMAQAMAERDVANAITARLDEQEEAVKKLTETYMTMRTHQRMAQSVIRLELSKWRAANAQSRAASTYYGEIGTVAESPFEKLSTLREKVLDASASSAAAIEMGEMKSADIVLDMPDYTALAKAEINSIAGSSSPPELSQADTPEIAPAENEDIGETVSVENEDIGA